MTVWTWSLVAVAALSVLALLSYLRRAAKGGDCVLVAHGLILLVGLVLSGLGVAALKLLSV